MFKPQFIHLSQLWNGLYCIVLYCIVLYCIVLYFSPSLSTCHSCGVDCTILYCIVLYCIVLYFSPSLSTCPSCGVDCTMLYCIVLYCISAPVYPPVTAVEWIVLYCTVLYFSPSLSTCHSCVLYCIVFQPQFIHLSQLWSGLYYIVLYCISAPVYPPVIAVYCIVLYFSPSLSTCHSCGVDCTILYCIVLYFSPSLSTCHSCVLYCIVLYCISAPVYPPVTAVEWIVLYCIVLYFSPSLSTCPSCGVGSRMRWFCSVFSATSWPVWSHSAGYVTNRLPCGGAGAEGVLAPLQGSNFAHKCISTIPIGAPIYIWPRAALPPALPLRLRIRHERQRKGECCIMQFPYISHDGWLFDDTLNTFVLISCDLVLQHNDGDIYHKNSLASRN